MSSDEHDPSYYFDSGRGGATVAAIRYLGSLSSGVEATGGEPRETIRSRIARWWRGGTTTPEAAPLRRARAAQEVTRYAIGDSGNSYRRGFVPPAYFDPDYVHYDPDREYAPPTEAYQPYTNGYSDEDYNRGYPPPSQIYPTGR